MLHESFWQRLNPVNRIYELRLHPRLYSLEEMQMRLAKERARADRSGNPLCLLAFDVGQGRDRLGRVKELTDALYMRKRLSDEVGWLHGSRVGVLLPETSESGALKLAQDIQNALEDDTQTPACQVYVYSSSHDEHKGNGSELELAYLEEESVQEKAGYASSAYSSNGPAFRLPDVALEPSYSKAQSLATVASSPLPTWKRWLDLIVASISLVVLSPIFLLIAVVIKLSSAGPVFFKQERIGYLGKPFRFWKFRTMHTGADTSIHSEHLRKLIKTDIPMEKLDSQDDPRIFPAGNFLRQSCLDELPQLFNVLIGDMSIVGPRPCLAYEVKNYSRWQTVRFDSVPGMTGLWQVSGKNRTTFKEMIRLDIRYGRERSPWLDFKIMLLTFPFMFEQIKLGFAKRSCKGEYE